MNAAMDSGEPADREDASGDDRVAGVIGMEATRDDVVSWRRRMNEGPFRRGGDAGRNSPPQGAEVVNSSRAALGLVRSPRDWRGVSASGCVTIDRDAIGTAPDADLRKAKTLADTAFVALAVGDDTMMRRVAGHLTAQADYADLRFGDRARWCLGRPNVGGHDGLGHTLGALGGFWAVALDWVGTHERLTGTNLMSGQERSRVSAWLAALGEWLRSRNDSLLDECFRGRRAGDYTVTARGGTTPGYSRPLYGGGPTPRLVSVRYSNKFTMRARAYGLIGVVADRPDLADASRRFFQEFLRYAFFPGGAVSDQHRGGSQGWKYSATQVGCATHVAYALHRQGDDRLKDYATTDGAFGSEGSHFTGGPKTLRKCVEDLCRYIPGVPGGFGRGISPGNRVEDVGMAAALRMWPDSDIIRAGLTRRAAGWPAQPAQGKHGDRGLHTASLLMYS